MARCNVILLEAFFCFQISVNKFLYHKFKAVDKFIANGLVLYFLPASLESKWWWGIGYLVRCCQQMLKRM